MDAVTTPSSLWDTAFCVASEKTGIASPRPIPNTAILRMAVPTLFITIIMAMPAIIIGTPISAYRLYLPFLAINCPATALVITMTIDIGMVT
ncbi:hypothetical protein D3C81_1457970 [compost metagenome]